MIPILFEKDTTDFSTLGIGVLTDCVNVICKRALNGIDELSMTYPDNGVRVAELQNSRIIYAQPEYKKDPQPYVIYDITKPVRGLITVYARHIRERASFIPVMPFSASSLAETLTKIPDFCAEDCPFTFWTDKTTTANFRLKTPASLGNVLGGMEGSILDTFGGEYEFDGFTVKLWNRRGIDRGVTLRYGKNVTDATQEENIEATITGICPFWTDGEDALVTLPEKVVYSQNAANFPFKRTIPKDFSEAFEEQPTVAQLRAAAQAYISQSGIGIPKVTLSVSFEHLAQYEEYKDRAVLETVNLGDTITVIFERLGVNATARVVQTEYDVLNEKYRQISIGGVKSNLGTAISGAVETAKAEARDVRSSLQKNIDRATDMLTGVNGGYLVDIFDANNQRTGDMIMDTNDPATATNVWLRNLAGWGFSSTGVNGQYRTAITQDGHIVADFVDTGELTANIIKTGMLKSSQNNNNFWNLDTGEIKIGTNANIAGWEIKSSYLGKTGTLNGTPYLAFMQAPKTPSGNAGVFGLRTGTEGNYSFPFIVRYNGTVEATNAVIEGTITTNALTATGGTVGGWTIGTSGLSKGTTFDNHDYEVGMLSPTTPRSTTPAFYVGYPTGVGSAWEYVYKVDYSGKLTAKKAEITGTITGSTITSTAERTYESGDYSSTDIDTVVNISISGRYPTAAQLTKYDFNQDGVIDVHDMAIIYNIVNKSKDYIGTTRTMISPTNTNAPIQISYGGAFDGDSATLTAGTSIGTQHIRTAAFLAVDGSNVRGAFDKEGVKLYDSSRYLRTTLTADGLTFLNTSGDVTAKYSSFRASGYVTSWSVRANSTATKTVSFGKTFPAAPYVWVQLTQSADNTIYGNVNLAVTDTTTTGFTVMAFNSSSSNAGMPFRWMTF